MSRLMFVESDCCCDYGEARQCELHAGFEPEEREIDCEACEGTGRVWYESRWTDGMATCRHCEGRGRITVTVEPITMGDLDDGQA